MFFFYGYSLWLKLKRKRHFSLYLFIRHCLSEFSCHHSQFRIPDSGFLIPAFRVALGARGLGRDTIRSFLQTYEKKDPYTVSQLPDPLSREVRVLPFLMCGTFSKRILEANLWLSSGGTRSMLHKDADNAINCLLNGTKDWILIHPDNEENVSRSVAFFILLRRPSDCYVSTRK